jgi:uncharacterized membrane protein YeaQ/YmgE (transglycosylase-associated protein family)
VSIALLVCAGAVVGWLGYAVVGYNAERGLVFSILVGALGGFIGGSVLAPKLISTAAAHTDVSAPAVFIAAAAAAVLLLLGNLVHKRWGI